METPFDSTDNLIACPTCDALYTLPKVQTGGVAACSRCHTVLLEPRRSAMTHILMLSVTALVLLIAAVWFPFLAISASGLGTNSSVLDAISAFSDEWMLPLSVAVGGLIVILPGLRLILLIYVFAPMAIGHAPARFAGPAFRWAAHIRPWAMAEVFIIGVAVALVKLADLAQVSLGPAFWAFVGLVIVTILKDNTMDRFSVWQTLDTRRRF